MSEEESEVPKTDNEGGENETSFPESDATAVPEDNVPEGGVDEEEEYDESEEGEEMKTGPNEDELEKQRITTEYMAVIVQIDGQNRIVDAVKKELNEICQKCPRDACDEAEIKELQCCLKKENAKLKCLVKEAMKLQEIDSSRNWKDISLTTTVEEDTFPFSFDFKKGAQKKSRQSKGVYVEDDRKKDFICNIMKEVRKCKSGKYKSKEECLSKILCALRQQQQEYRKIPVVCSSAKSESEHSHEICERKKTKSLCGGDNFQDKFKNICQQMMRDLENSRKKLVDDNQSLESDRQSLQYELSKRDKKILCLQNRIDSLQNELCTLYEGGGNGDNTSPSNGSDNESPCRRTMKNVKNNNAQSMTEIEKLQYELDCLTRELKTLKLERSEENVYLKEPCQYSSSSSSRGYDDHNKDPFSKKNICRPKKGITDIYKNEKAKKEKGICDIDSLEDENDIEMLRERIVDLQDEQESLKNLFCEQAEQSKEYQCKYEVANQTANEQKCVLEKVKEQNKRIENQINYEIQQVKDKFQDKLKELAEIPKLIENEKSKIKIECQEKLELENKLCIICKEYRELKCKMDAYQGDDDQTEWEEKFNQLQLEIESEKALIEQQEQENNKLNEELEEVTSKTDALRNETACEIVKIKEKSEQSKLKSLLYIQRLEKNIADSSVTASSKINDYEEVIEKMRKQLNILSYSFDAAQKQIKCLRKHIYKLSTEEGICLE